MPISTDFGRDRYSYIDSQRYRVASGQTLKPLQGETNELFEQRMDHIARQFGQLEDVRSVEVEFDIRDGRIVLALIVIHHAPVLAPIERDDRVAGGRIQARGKRAA